MNSFLYFWFIEEPINIKSVFLRFISYLDDRIALKATAEHISEPLFQDYDWQGRLIGIIFRIFRIILGITAYLLICVIGIIFIVFWLLLPLLVLFNLVSWLFL